MSSRSPPTIPASKQWSVRVNPVSRGVAYFDGRLFRGTGDARLVALDAKSGKELWRVKAGGPREGEFFSAAPIAWNGLVFIGPVGSDNLQRSFTYVTKTDPRQSGRGAG